MALPTLLLFMIEAASPTRREPTQDRLDPTRAKLRSEIELPQSKYVSVERDEPIWPAPRREKVEARKKKSQTDSPPAILENLRTLNVEPRFTCDATDTEPSR
jgi:hypothetical protein